MKKTGRSYNQTLRYHKVDGRKERDGDIRDNSEHFREFQDRICPRNVCLVSRNYLTRIIVVMEDGYRRAERQVKTECPQGSVLGSKF